MLLLGFQAWVKHRVSNIAVYGQKKVRHYKLGTFQKVGDQVWFLDLNLYLCERSTITKGARLLSIAWA